MIHTAERLDTVQEYYFSKKLAEVRQLIEQGKPIINMGIGSPDLEPPVAIKEAMNKALLDKGAHQYQSYTGRPELREAIAQFYKKWYQVDLDPSDQILPMIGSKEAIMHISLAFLNPGDEVLVPNPGYPTYTSVTKLVQASIVYYDLNEHNHWLPDLEALKKRDLTKVKLMWINYPHMPTGAKANLKQFEKIVQFAKDHDILVVNDNPYSFILNKQPLSILKVSEASDYVLELNSLSKAFNMAGWRVGMVVGKSDYIKHILKVKSNMDSGMFYGIQKGAIAALNIDKSWFEDINKTYRERKSSILKIADRLNCSYDEHAQGMFVWAKLPEGAPDAVTFCDELLYEKNIFVAPGSIFGTNGEGYIRFSLCLDISLINKVLLRL